MKAAQLTAVHQFAVATVAEPIPGPGEALVAIRAAALNHRDVWIKAGEYAGLKWPCIPGSDGAGVVAATGDGVDPAAWQGREVIINPSFNWGASESAQGEQFSILGLPRNGTLAEKIAVPVEQLTAKPPHLTWEEAAALPLAGLTAYRAVFSRGALQSGERVLVNGIGGGVALFALQFAIAAGAKVWVTSSSPEKIAQATELGAQGGYNYKDADWAKATRPLGGFHLLIDSAGGPGFSQLIEAAASGARIVFYGATRGDPPTLPSRKVFWRQLSLLGTTMGSPADWGAMISFVGRHKLRPIVSNVFPLDRAAEAFALMERGDQFGKIVVTMS